MLKLIGGRFLYLVSVKKKALNRSPGLVKTVFSIN